MPASLHGLLHGAGNSYSRFARTCSGVGRTITIDIFPHIEN